MGVAAALVTASAKVADSEALTIQAGAVALGAAAGDGALRQLTKLCISNNQIGSGGAASLAAAAAAGELPSLQVTNPSTKLELYGFNPKPELELELLP